MSKYLRSDDDYVYLDCEYAEAYIPKDLFAKTDTTISESAVAYEYGNGFKLVGVFYIRFADSENSTMNGKPNTFCYPNVIETYPSSNSVRSVDLGTGEPVQCRVLEYRKGDIIMNVVNKQDVRNCEQFMGLLNSGRIPSSLSYWEIFNAWMLNFDINGFDPGVPTCVLMGYISELCRAPSDPQTQFRKVIGKDPSIDPYSYMSLDMNEMSAYSSTMSALSFERLGQKITNALIMEKEGIKQPISPIEKVIVM